MGSEGPACKAVGLDAIAALPWRGTERVAAGPPGARPRRRHARARTIAALRERRPDLRDAPADDEDLERLIE